jgi:tRNA threonylcarbamoyladenosine biosynthesis protein TsaE
MRLDSASEAATEALGASLAPWLEPGDVVALRGPLGAGKTRFVAGLARGLSAAARVRSPSFALVHEYHGRLPLLHLDLYRLDPREVPGLGIEEGLERAAMAVEWADKLPEWLGRDALSIAFEITGESTRALTVAAAGGRGAALLAAWRAALGAAA